MECMPRLLSVARITPGQERNERSFKLLQEYIALARGGDPRSPAARLPYRFVFYMREEPRALGAEEADQEALAGPTRKALSKLLAACGLATTGRDADTAGGEEEGGQGEGPLSLAAFLPEAVELLRQAEAARPSDPAVRVANLRGALRLHHQVMVSFADKQLAPARQAALLERLARLVGATPGLRLQGCHIVMGDRLGLDRLGQLCLSASEPDDAWADFLAGVDLDFVRQQRAAVQALRNLEASVARAAGVAQIFTPYGNLTEPSYRAFLERLADAANSRGPLGSAEARELSLCVLPAAGPGLAYREDGPREAACRLDASAAGVLQVDSDAAADDVYAGVAALGADALRALRAQRHTEQQLRGLADQTRLRLRLRSLTRDPRVSPADFRRVCGMLLDQSAALMPLLEGCTVRVAFANRLAPDGSCIEVAHNCQL
ncbi:hypothetical protein GPECTOR_2g1164 [Gonium pectorale]|uniref:DUF4461 domain-containing protein n=1 Tax=Gonium pectorale TaxID=33097 RepID=A0A150H0Q4_GONPE|nr:hypothetical protein GPECTOR_2g1164 [Gonium pectorale]|eukprot:KXZ55614.1 hypothetical protein GPECTOR_2g1164 [Gonium pectorale]